MAAPAKRMQRSLRLTCFYDATAGNAVHRWPPETGLRQHTKLVECPDGGASIVHLPKFLGDQSTGVDNISDVSDVLRH